MAITEPTRVFLVDDHPIVRMGFRRLLDGYENLSVSGEAGSGEEALEKMPGAPSDLALVDISMNGMDGIELTRRLKEKYPELRVLIVTMHDDRHYLDKALKAGANGYILKDNVDESIQEATREVLAGRQYLRGKVQDPSD